ncbi:hypothetical protein MP228_002479 [Amoeboaphelidium protococcarum]|nr:hypothetical protein MP228_002479 [Amoeboaphelidium protococcarum]
MSQKVQEQQVQLQQTSDVEQCQVIVALVQQILGGQDILVADLLKALQEFASQHSSSGEKKVEVYVLICSVLELAFSPDLSDFVQDYRDLMLDEVGKMFNLKEMCDTLKSGSKGAHFNQDLRQIQLRITMARIVALMFMNLPNDFDLILNTVLDMNSSDYVFPLMFSCIPAQVDLILSLVQQKQQAHNQHANGVGRDYDDGHVQTQVDKIYQMVDGDLSGPCKSAILIYISSAIKTMADKVAQSSGPRLNIEQLLISAVQSGALQFICDQVIPFKSDAVFNFEDKSHGLQRRQIYELLYASNHWSNHLIYAQLTQAMNGLINKFPEVVRLIKSLDEGFNQQQSSPQKLGKGRSRLFGSLVQTNHISSTSTVKDSQQISEKSAPHQKQYLVQMLELLCDLFAAYPQNATQLLGHRKRAILRQLYDDKSSHIQSRCLYYKMLGLAALDSDCATQVYDFLCSYSVSSTLSWSYLNSALDHYINEMHNLKTDYNQELILSDDIELLKAMLFCFASVVASSVSAKYALYDNGQTLKRLFDLLVCHLPTELKAAHLDAIAAFTTVLHPADSGEHSVVQHGGQNDMQLVQNFNLNIWQLLEQSNFLPADYNGGYVHDFEQVEVREGWYYESVAFCRLLSQLLQPMSRISSAKYYDFAYEGQRCIDIMLHDQLVNSSQPGGRSILDKYLQFVMERIVCRLDLIPFNDTKQRWKLYDYCFRSMESVLYSIDINLIQNKSFLQTLRNSQDQFRSFASHPSIKCLIMLCSNEKVIKSLFHVCMEGCERLDSSEHGANYSSSITRCLRIVLQLLCMQNALMDLLPELLRINGYQPLEFRSVIDYLSRNGPVVCQLASYVASQSYPEVAYVSMRILKLLSRSNLFAQQTSHQISGSGGLLFCMLKDSPLLERIIAGYQLRFTSEDMNGSTSVSLVMDGSNENIQWHNTNKVFSLKFIADLFERKQSSLGLLLLGLHQRLDLWQSDGDANVIEFANAPGCKALLELFEENHQVLSHLNGQRLDDLPFCSLPPQLRHAESFTYLLSIIKSLMSLPNLGRAFVRYLKYSVGFFIQSLDVISSPIVGHVKELQSPAKMLILEQMRQKQLLLSILALHLNYAKLDNDNSYCSHFASNLLTNCSSMFSELLKQSCSPDILVSFTQSQISEQQVDQSIIQDYSSVDANGCLIYDIMQLKTVFDLQMNVSKQDGQPMQAQHQQLLHHMEEMNQISLIIYIRSQIILLTSNILQLLSPYMLQLTAPQDVLQSFVDLMHIRSLHQDDYTRLAESYLVLSQIPSAGQSNLISFVKDICVLISFKDRGIAYRGNLYLSLLSFISGEHAQPDMVQHLKGILRTVAQPQSLDMLFRDCSSSGDQSWSATALSLIAHILCACSRISSVLIARTVLDQMKKQNIINQQLSHLLNEDDGKICQSLRSGDVQSSMVVYISRLSLLQAVALFEEGCIMLDDCDIFSVLQKLQFPQLLLQSSNIPNAGAYKRDKGDQSAQVAVSYLIDLATMVGSKLCKSVAVQKKYSAFMTKYAGFISDDPEQ